MKTDDLISAISADAATPPRRLGPALVAGLVLSAAAAAIVFATVLHIRPDVAQALATVRFPLKFVFVAAFAAAAVALVLRLARPGADSAPARRGVFAAAALLGVAVIVELSATQSGDWPRMLFGRNWLLCLACIPMLSAVPLAILIAALRRGAPDSPAALGAAAGLLAGTVGALFYAAHCVDDSPLFVAAWYSAAIALVTAAGAAAGARLLRW